MAENRCLDRCRRHVGNDRRGGEGDGPSRSRDACSARTTTDRGVDHGRCGVTCDAEQRTGDTPVHTHSGSPAQGDHPVRDGGRPGNTGSSLRWHHNPAARSTDGWWGRRHRGESPAPTSATGPDTNHDPTSPAEQRIVIYGRFSGMGTAIDVWAPDGPSWYETRDLLEGLEAELSRFRPDSELSRLNADARPEVEVSPLLGDLLTAADTARRRTNGMVDVGVGGLVSDWGYDTTFASVVDQTQPPVAGPATEWHYEPDSRLLARGPGTKIDLGGIAKGWAADRAVESGPATVVSVGGDLRSVDPETTVPVGDGLGGSVTEIVLGFGGLATSSTLRRSWKVGNKRVSHIIDPRTGAPVDSPIVSATVVADSAVEAEVAAKAVLLKGEQGLAWADGRSWIRAAMVVWTDGSVFATTDLKVAA